MAKKLLATSVALACSVLMAGSAHADALGQAILDLSGLTFYAGASSASPVLDAGAFSSLTITDQYNLNATLNGVTSSGTGFVVGGAGFPLTTKTVGTPLAPFTNVATPTTNSGVAGIALSGVPITNIPGGPFPIGGHSQTGALASVLVAGTANSAAALTLNSGFTFTLGQAVPTLSIGFTGSQYQTSWLNGALNATSQNSLTFSIVNNATGATMFSWSPNGTGIGDSTGTSSVTETFVSGTAGLTSCNLNRNTGVTSLGGPIVQQDVQCTGTYFATTAANLLQAGVSYTFNIAQSSQANVLVPAATVPEPTSIALVGLALVGMGFAGSRRKQAKRG